MKKLCILLVVILLTGCAHNDQTVSQNSLETQSIYEYLPIFADKSDKEISGNIDKYTFIHLHCDSETNWAYIQDFSGTESTSPLYVYEFTNNIKVNDLMLEMPARSKEFEVEEEGVSLVENFYDHLEQYSDPTWQVYEYDGYTFSYANVIDDDGHYYNEKRIYKDGKPVCFMKELSDEYKVQDVTVTNEAYVWLAKE